MSSLERVSFVTTSLLRGGAETQVFLLARSLRARGHPVQLVTMRAPEAYEAECADAGIDLVTLGMRSGVPDPRGLLRLARGWRRFRPDVAHAHMVHAVLLARLARPFARVPVLVSTAHSLNEGGRWRELAYRLTDRLGDLTTNVCQAAVDRYVAVGAAPCDRIVRVPNGLDLTGFGPDPTVRARVRIELGATDDTFAWIAVGRLDTPKDVPTLLEAFRSLPERAKLWLVGDGPLRGDLEDRRDALGIDSAQVRFLGARTDVSDLMRAADGYAMSSAWEGLPMVLLEAAATGLPIVATDVGGNSEIVLDGANGRLVPPHDPSALAAAFTATMELPETERAAWGRAARAHVASEFDLERIVDAWLALYRRLRAGTPTEAHR